MRYITSFSAEGYELYGRTFLETFMKYHHEHLTVYVEGEKQVSFFEMAHPGLNTVNLWSTGAMTFIDNHCDLPAFHGIEMNGKRNYRFDIARFCRKSFAQIHAAKRPLLGPLVWIDADIEFEGRLPEPKFEGEFMQYLGRPEWHSCASYVAWDLEHEASALFWRTYEELYLTGNVFRLPEWHDSYILDYIRKALGFKAKNLADHVMGLRGPANVFNYVFPMANHKKGNLKFK